MFYLKKVNYSTRKEQLGKKGKLIFIFFIYIFRLGGKSEDNKF